MKFCNIDFNILRRAQLFERSDGETKCIATVNAQFIVLANTNPRYMNYINSNYATFDGEVPLRVAKKYSQEFKNAEKLPGSEIVYDFARYAKANNLRMFFLGGKADSNSAAVEKIKNDYGIQIEGYSPAFEEYPFSHKFMESCFDKISAFMPDIVFVGFGAPKQEFFIEDNIGFFKEHNVKYLIGSGGTFEFVGGKIKRAPMWIQKAGLEGFYRFFQEISFFRLKRILYSFRFFKYIKTDKGGKA